MEMMADNYTAQTAYTSFIKDYISPAFRARGLKGSGGKYEFPNADYFVLVGFQKNKWNSRDLVEFRVNLSVINKKDWEIARVNEPWLGIKPLPSSEYPVKMWTGELGGSVLKEFFLTGTWLKIDTDTNLEILAQEVLRRFDTKGMRAINKRINITLMS